MDSLSLTKTGGVVQIALSTTPFAKFILLLLLVTSVAAWAIIIRKWLQFSAVRRANRTFLSLFQHRGNILQFRQSANRFPQSPLPVILDEALLEWQRLGLATNPGPEITAVTAELALRTVSDVMSRRISLETENYERTLPFLATAGSASPFLGLLGTVWGIMKSFMDIRGLPTVNVQTVAPGIADALIVTAAGLLVAVPAVVFYNHFLGQIKDLVNTMERFSSEVASELRRSLIQTRS